MAERVVSWKAIADFAAVGREARRTERALESLRKKQRQLNAESRTGGVDTSGAESVTKAAADTARASDRAATAANRNVTAQQKQVNALRAAERASRSAADGMKEAATEANTLAGVASKVATTARQIETASTRTTRARAAEADAARKVAIAEARLNEVRNNSKSTASQVLAAEDRLIRSQRALADAHDRTATSAGGAGRGVNGLGKALGALTPNFDRSNRGAIRFVGSLLMITTVVPAVLGGINALIALVGPLSAAVTGLAGAIAPVAGLLGTLPGLLLAVGGAAGTLIAGFSGIGEALKAYQKQQDAAAKASANAGKEAAQNAARQLRAQRQQESALKRVRDADNAARQTAEENARAIRDAKRGLSDAQENAAESAENSARRIADAERALRDAQESRTETLETSQRAIVSAERSVADAQLRAIQAQEGITAARIRAQQQIDDLKDSLRDLALQEEGASLSVEEARLRLQRTLNDPASTDLERRGAELAVREAQARLADVQDAQKENEAALKDAQKKGVEGSDEVVEAKNAEAEAQQDLIDSQRDLIDARREAAKAARDSARAVVDAERSMADARTDATRSARDSSRAVADAQERLNDAYRDSQRRTEDAQEAIVEANQALGDLAITTAGTDGAAPAVDEFAEAMKKLTPEARAVVQQLLKMKPLIDAIRRTAQRGLLPGVLEFLIDAEKLFPVVNDFVGRAARSFGDFFARVGEAMSTRGALDMWRRALESTNRVIDIFLDAAFNVMTVLGRIVVAGGPLTEWLAATVRGWTESWEAMTAGEDGMRRLEGFFDNTREAAELLGDIIGNLAGTLYNLGRGTQDLGKWILEAFRDMTQGWVDWTSSVEGQNALRQWAEDSKAPLSALAALVGDLIQGLIEIGSEVDLTALIDQIRNQLLPAFLDFMKVFTDEDMTSTLIRLFSSFLRILTALAESGVLDLIVQGLEGFAGALEWVLNNVPGGDKLIGGILIAMAGLQLLRFTGLTKSLGGVVSALKDIRKESRKTKDALKDASAPRRSSGDTSPRATPPKLAQRAVPKVNIGKLIMDSLPMVGATLVGLLPQIGSWIMRVALPAIARLAAAIPGIGWIIAIVATVLSVVLPMIIDNWDQISQFLIDKTNEIKSFFEPIWSQIAGFVVTAFENVRNFLGGVFAAIASIFDVFVQIGVAIFKTFAGLIYALIIRPFSLAFAWINTKLTEFGVWLAARITEFVAGVQVIWAWIYDHLVKPIQDFIGWIGVKLGEFGRWLSARFNEFVTAVRIIWNKIYDTLISPIEKATRPVRELIGGIVSAFIGKATEVIDWLKETWSTVTGFISAPIKAAWEVVKKPLEDFVASVTKVFSGLVAGISAAWNGLVEAISNPIDTALGAINGFINGVRDLFGKLQVPKELWPETIVWNKPGAPPAWRPQGAQRGLKEGGRVPGPRHTTHRDTVPAVNSKGQHIANVESGEWVAPRWMSPLFPTFESIRRRGKNNLKDGGFLTGGTKPAQGPANRHNDGYSWTRWAGDIPAPSGSPVVAYKDGNVSATKYWNYSYGNHIKINHGSGEKTLYAHLSSILVNAGERVAEAALIGRVGSTGNSTGPHLHFELSGGSDAIEFGEKGDTNANPIVSAVQELLGNLSPAQWLQERLDSAIASTTNPFLAMAAGVGKRVLNAAVKIAGFSGEGDPTGQAPGSFGKGSGSVNGGYVGPNARKAAGDVGPKFGFSDIGTYPGHDPSQSRALDFMTKSKSQGDSAVAYMKQNAARLGVMYLIWWRKIWSVARNSEGWRPYSGTSNPHTDHVHASFYAKGTNSASQGPIVVGENGPEIMWARGGERIQKNAIARQNLPKYHEGGYVNGMAPGGRGNWVRALRSQLGLGISDGWSTTLSRALQKKDPQPVSSFKLNAAFMKRVADTLKRYTKYGFWDVAKKLKVDPGYLWRHGSDKGLWGAFKKYKVPAKQQTHFRNGWRDYVNARHAGVKDLEKRLGLKQDGIWGNEITAPLAHALDHMFKRPHDALASRPWKAFTPTELALQEQRRTNSLNAEWDRLVKGFQAQKLDHVVRKLNELGIADGLALARDLAKSTPALRQEYNRNLKVEYDRADAQDPNTQAGRIQLFVQAVGSGTPAKPVGLHAASSAAQVSLDTGAMLYDKINLEKLWGSVTSAQRKRVDGDVQRFRKLFRFAKGGPVPGYGNGDRVHLLGEPGEFMLRRLSVAALERDYGPGVMGALNHYDKMANGGFVAGGVSRPGARAGSITISRGETSETSNSRTVNNTFNTNIYNPVGENSAVSLQKAVTRKARLGLFSGDPR